MAHAARATPGYPLVLLATGAHDESSRWLFLLQLLLHLACMLLAVDIARSAGSDLVAAPCAPHCSSHHL